MADERSWTTWVRRRAIRLVTPSTYPQVGICRYLNSESAVPKLRNLPTANLGSSPPPGSTDQESPARAADPDGSGDVSRSREVFDARSYDRRALVEGLFGNVRYNASNINRGYLRVRGFFGTAFLLALAMPGCDAKRLHQLYFERDRPDPWQIELDEEPEAITLDPIYRTRGP